MSEERVKRKLSAILSADVVGYSRMMGEDEVSTVRTLEAYRKVMSDLIEQFRGRVVDSPGDNLLSEFSSGNFRKKSGHQNITERRCPNGKKKRT